MPGAVRESASGALRESIRGRVAQIRHLSLDWAMPAARSKPEPEPRTAPRPAAGEPGPEILHFPVAIPVPDISPWLAGNTGIPGFTTRDSGRPGPHVALISLIHGNELAGAIALEEMLRGDVWPNSGKLTFGFANIAAFARFDAANPAASRFVEEDMNRVWDDIQLFGVRRSLELDRAREIRPLIDTADTVLDLHSMLWPSDPLILCGMSGPSRRLAMALGTPDLVVADRGHAGGKRLIDYPRFTEAGCSASCVLVEAGQHWEPATIAQARRSIAALLHVTGLRPITPEPERSRARFAEVTHLITARTNRFIFTRAFRGGEIIRRAGTPIAHDGDTEIRTPYADCLLIMPSHRPILGHTVIRLAKIRNDDDSAAGAPRIRRPAAAAKAYR